MQGGDGPDDHQTEAAAGRTRRAGLLTGTFLVLVSAFDYLLHVLPSESIPAFVYGVRHAFLIASELGQVTLTFAPGVVVIFGLAAIHAAINAGYLPSLLLATAPTYATYIFTVPGPVTGVVVPVGDHVVFAPVWAAFHVVPTALVVGTIGFLSGIVFQYFTGGAPPVPGRQGEGT